MDVGSAPRARPGKRSRGSEDPTLGLSEKRGVFWGDARKPGQCGDLGDPRLEIELDGRDYQGKRRKRGRQALETGGRRGEKALRSPEKRGGKGEG